MIYSIIETLSNKGYKAEHNEVKKGQVTLNAIIVGEGTIRPSIYIDDIMSQLQDIEAIANKIIDIYEEHKTPDIDIETILTKEYIISHLNIALQRVSDNNITKKSTEYEGIEQYLIILGDDFSIRVQDQILTSNNIDIEKAWEIALENLNKTTTIKSMANILHEQTGLPEEFFENFPMWVISNDKNIKGASAILNRKLIKDFASEQGTDKVYFIPSSIHEAIIIPYTDDTNIEQLSSMVQDVNSTEVSPEEQLSDKAFLIEL